MAVTSVPLMVLGGVGATLGAMAAFAKLSEEILEGESLALDTAGQQGLARGVEVAVQLGHEGQS